MHQNDFEGFAKLLKRMAVTYGKKLDDELTHAYWIALKDQPLDRIVSMADHRMKHSKFFPKPVELRPAEECAPPVGDGKFEEGEERAIRNLEDLRRENPKGWFERVGQMNRAACYANEFDVNNIWYDIAKRCWNHHP